MGRSGSVGSAVFVLMLSSLAIGALSCGGSNATKTVPDEVPAIVTLSPANTASLDVGATQNFAATARNRNNQAISETFSYQSSNPAVVTIASTGVVCAGTWDSLTAPVICTPGPIGVAQVTASARGVSSPPTTVYVHQHITNIEVSVVPSQTNPPGPCYSKAQVLDFQATAYSGSGGNLTDITSTVGQFSFQVGNSNVVTVKTLSQNSSGQTVLNQAETTATTPGTTPLYASVSGVNSSGYNFVTCAVQEITLSVPNDSNTSFVVPTGTTTTVDATVIDSLGNTITGVPLTWSSSNRTSVGVTALNGSATFGSVATVGASSVGASAVIASCTPPTCNIGFSPTLPIYPTGVISFIVTGNASSTTYSMYVASTGTGIDPSTNQPWSCATITSCFSDIIPLTVGGTGTVTVGNAVTLPSPPNSLLFESGGTAAYLGVDSGQLGTKGLMALAASNNAVTQDTGAPGRVLAVSPNGQTVVTSDTVDLPNEVYLVETNTSSPLPKQITGATAAAFSPDNLKVYILAGNTLYIYSALDDWKTVQLGALGFVPSDVAFLPIGAFALIAGSPDTVTAYTTCTNGVALDSGHTPQIVATPGLPSMLRPLPDGTQVLAMDPPGIDYLSVNTTSTGCPPTMSSSFAGSVNLGIGSFVPTQFIVSPDGLAAYILTQNSGVILVLNIANQTTSAIALTGNAIALQAALTPDGKFLYVGAEDTPPTSPTPLGSVHVLDTTAGADVQQITFPQTPQPFCIGPGNPPLPPPPPATYCYPDLIAVKP
ncbi:MAG: hypothetical protein WB421_21485 [Terriglobales bacterium]